MANKHHLEILEEGVDVCRERGDVVDYINFFGEARRQGAFSLTRCMQTIGNCGAFRDCSENARFPSPGIYRIVGA